eukprot:gene19056-20970_t
MGETIRIWNIETFLETYRFNAQEPVTGFKLTGPTSILYSTVREIKVWHLNLFYTLFTNVGARALRLSRVSAEGLPNRIIYIAADGGIRLISPVHGSVLSMTFPIINHYVIDGLHDVRANAMYVLLSSGNVMVFSTETNPCSTVQLWVAETYDDRICSIEILESALLKEENDIAIKSSLLFGGHMNGHISLLKGKGYQLLPHKAHQGSVTMLKTRKFHHGTERKQQTPCNLISLGSDNMIILWCVGSSFNDELGMELNLQPIMRIDMVIKPKDMILIGNTFVIITQQSLFMYNMNSVTDCYKAALSYNQGEFLTKCKRHEHFGSITQMCACDSLSIIATCGTDCHVRIWNTNGQLVRELSFDEETQGVCFSNDRGDLMIGLQNNLFYVPAWKYLTPCYLRRLLEMDVKDDENEKCISFDQLLKFWYNDRWVSTIPIGRTNMARVCRSAKKSIGLNANEYERLRTLLLLKQEDDCGNHDDQEVIAKFCEQARARRRSTVVRISKTDLSTLSSSKNKSHRKHKLPPLIQHSTHENGSMLEASADTFSLQVSKDLQTCAPSDDVRNFEMGHLNTKAKEDCIDLSTSHHNEEDHCMKHGLHDSGKLSENSVAYKNVYWPCAPDGNIPNSVIRSSVKPAALPDYTELVRQADAREKEDADANFAKMLLYVTLQTKLAISKTQIDAQPIQKKEIDIEVPQQGDTGISWQAGERFLYESASSGEEDDGEDGIDEEEREEEDDVNIEENVEIHPDVTAKSKKLSPKNVRKTKKKRLESERRESKQMAKEKSKKNSLLIEQKKEPIQVVSTTGLQKKVTTGPYPTHGTNEDNDQDKTDQEDCIPDILRRKMTKPWFPKPVQTDVSNIVTDLSGKLEDADATTMRDITALLLDIQSHLGMPTPVLDGLLESLKNLTASDKATATRHCAVKTIVELGEKREDVIADMVNLLSDPAEIIRDEAKNGLKSLAGIEDFESLCNAMQEMNLLKEDIPPPVSNDLEVIEELLSRKMPVHWKERNSNIEVNPRTISDWMTKADHCKMDVTYDTCSNEWESSYEGVWCALSGQKTKDDTMSVLKLGETIDASRCNETIDASRCNETIDASKPNETINVSRSHKVMDVSRSHKVMDGSRSHKTSNVLRQNRTIGALDETIDALGRSNSNQVKLEHSVSQTSTTQRNICNSQFAKDNKETNSVYETEIKSDMIASIAPRLYEKFKDHNIESGKEPQREIANKELKQNEDRAPCNTMELGNFKNQVYSSINKVASNGCAHTNTLTGATIQVGDEDRNDNEELKNVSSWQGPRQNGKGKTKIETRSLSRCTSNERQHVASLLLETSLFALAMRRKMTSDNKGIVNEEALKLLRDLLQTVNRDNVSITGEFAHQTLLFIDTLRKELHEADTALAAKYSLGPTSNGGKAERMIANNVRSELDRAANLNHRQKLIESRIGATMVRGIRGERIAKALEIRQMSGNYNNSQGDTDRMEHRIFGIPERLGSYAATDYGACRFGKMKISWTARAPSYDMDLAILNEQRIRPLKLRKRPELYERQQASIDKQRQDTNLPLLAKKRIGTHLNISRRKTRMSGDEIVKLPLLASNGYTTSQRSGSSVSMNSEIYHNIAPRGMMVQPPPPPNTAEFI